MLIAERAKAFTLVLLECLLWLQSMAVVSAGGWTNSRKQEVLNQTRALWYHGYDNYMLHAFPADELRPLSCQGRGPDYVNLDNYGNNDVAANVSLTLIDILDTFVVLGDFSGFNQSVHNVIQHVSFDVNTKPQVFEITIRVLGGLLSGHIHAADVKSAFYLPWYRGELLHLAHNLGERLLTAFRTSTGLPYARINLRHGVLKGESIETCTAGAGSLIIEFAVLSRLTGDERFEKAATKAFFALWNRRSDLNLVGNTLNIWTGAWTPPLTAGIGAGIDSFYEYALKWYIMSGEVEYLDIFQEAYAAIMRYARSSDGCWFHSVWMNTGELAYATVDSLSAFWPGLQVLAGDVEHAVKSHLTYWNLWKRHSGLPEVFDINFSKAVALQYPLRPEFIESTYYLYRATKDPFYLDVGERILQDITARSKVPCGLTGILDLSNNTRDDRMESFVLSETLKYLILLFDESNLLHKVESNSVFTTEGHILYLNSTHMKPLSDIRRKVRGVEHRECPQYFAPGDQRPDKRSGSLTQGTHDRSDYEWARHVLSGPLDENQRNIMEYSDRPYWHVNGWCEVPKAGLYSYEFIFSPSGQTVPEDPAPGPSKLLRIPEGFLITNVTGIRVHVVSRIDGKGYDVTKLGPNAVRSGQKVYVTDDAIMRDGYSAELERQAASRKRDVPLRFVLADSDVLLSNFVGQSDTQREMKVQAFTAMFGADLSRKENNVLLPLPQMHLAHDPHNPFGCNTKKVHKFYENEIVVVHRGECTFVEKLRRITSAGAVGVLVVSDDNMPLNPSYDDNEEIADLSDKVLLVLTWSDGEKVLEFMDLATRHESEVLFYVDHDEAIERLQADASADSRQQKLPVNTPRQFLYLADRPILNMLIGT